MVQAKSSKSYKKIARDSNSTSIKDIKVKNVVATADTNNNYNVVLPYGTDLSLLTSSDINVTTTDSNATVSTITTNNNGVTWNVTVTASDKKTSLTYVINVTLKENPISLNSEPILGNNLSNEKASFTLDFSAINTTTLNVGNGKSYYMESNSNGNILCRSNTVSYSSGDKVAALVKAFDGLTLSCNSTSMKISNYQLSVDPKNSKVLIATAEDYGDKTSEFTTLNLGNKDNLKINLAMNPNIDFVDTTITSKGSKAEYGTATFNVDGTDVIENSKITALGKTFTIKYEITPTDSSKIDPSVLYMGTSLYTSEDVIDKLIEKLSSDETFDVTKVGSGNSAKIQFKEKESKRATSTIDTLKNLLSYSIN